ncbi:hypothetical protein MSAN_00775800 [Mycena sanguinolenta]|uniref:Uncharacterized protein n=1 Tax=Mycena sanguinolenta TaxID=230812 RepID=A0A8H6Z619_9AGAR|nr:hypothetical protein MSAN_00775800 [Mycena sanguinolenta]
MTLSPIAEKPDGRAGGKTAQSWWARESRVEARARYHVRLPFPVLPPFSCIQESADDARYSGYSSPSAPEGLLARHRLALLALDTTNGDYATGDSRHLACACPRHALSRPRAVCDLARVQVPRLALGAIRPVRSGEVAMARRGDAEHCGAVRLVLGIGERVVLPGDHIVALSARAPPPCARSRTSHRFRSFADHTQPAAASLSLAVSRRRRSSPRHAWGWKGQEGRAAGGEAMERVEGAGRR